MIPPEELTRMVEVFALKQERIEETQKEMIVCIEKIVRLTGELEYVLKGLLAAYYERQKTYEFETVQHSPKQIITPQQDNTD